MLCGAPRKTTIRQGKGSIVSSESSQAVGKCVEDEEDEVGVREPNCRKETQGEGLGPWS